MPASPAFPSENRTKWRKKRKGESQIGKRRYKHHRDDEDEEDHESEEDQLHRDDVSDDQPQFRRNSVEIEAVSLDGVRISEFPAVIKRAVTCPHSTVMAIVALERANESGDRDRRSQLHAPVLENLSHGQLQVLSSVPADSPSLVQDGGDGSNSSCVIAPPRILEGSGVVKRFGNRVLVVPMHSDWFSPAMVHRIERQVVPHFFSGKSRDRTPEKYMECRNYIVARYMDDLGKRITVCDCQGLLLVGVDNEELTRIFRFLDHWGIINYCVQEPSHEPRDNETYLKEETSGVIRVPFDALRSIDSLITFDKLKCKSLSTGNADISDLNDRISEHLSENNCNYCSRPLPVIFYQSQKEVDILLCTDCFRDGRFVLGHSSIDFVRVDSATDYDDQDGDSWTDQETLLLLEAVEIYNDKWNEIAEHVRTKSKAQCILHFLRLPMDDGKFEDINVSGTEHHSRDSDGRLPFENSANPVMALVAFLSSAVGPRVAAACAHAALAALSKNSSGSTSQMEVLEYDNRTNRVSINSRDGSRPGEIASSNQINDKAKALCSQAQNESGAAPLSAEIVRHAARVGLSAGAMKAKLFADSEEREIQTLSAALVKNQLKRLDLKLGQFDEIDTMLERESEKVQKTRERLVAERGVISASFSQPYMSFVPRPSTFGFGQRVPHSMIQQSLSAPSNPVFGAAGIVQRNTNPLLRHVPGTTSGLGYN